MFVTVMARANKEQLLDILFTLAMSLLRSFWKLLNHPAKAPTMIKAGGNVRELRIILQYK